MSSKIGIIKLPPLPDENDWGLKLVYQGPREQSVKYQEFKKEPQKAFILKKVLPYATAGSILIVLLIAFYRRSRRAR